MNDAWSYVRPLVEAVAVFGILACLLVPMRRQLKDSPLRDPLTGVLVAVFILVYLIALVFVGVKIDL